MNDVISMSRLTKLDKDEVFGEFPVQLTLSLVFDLIMIFIFVLFSLPVAILLSWIYTPVRAYWVHLVMGSGKMSLVVGIVGAIPALNLIPSATILTLIKFGGV